MIQHNISEKQHKITTQQQTGLNVAQLTRM